MSTKEKTGIELGKTLYNKMEPLETSKDNIDTENSKNNLTEELGENIQYKLLSFPNVSFCKTIENELEAISKNAVPNKLNMPVENASSKTDICDTIAELNCTWANENKHSDLQPYQSNKENIVGIASTFSPASISFLANAKLNDNSLSYNKNVLNLNSIMANEKPMKLEYSRNIVKYVLSSQISVSTSPGSKIAVGELIEQLLKRQSHDLFGKQKCCKKLNSPKMGIVSKECLLYSNLDSGVKYTLNNKTENVLSSTNKLLVHPETYIDIKEKQKKTINQRNVIFQLFEECNKDVIENDLSKSTEFLKNHHNAISNNLDLAPKTNLSLVGSSCKMNLFDQLGETPTYEQSAGNALTFLKHKLLLSDTMIVNSTAIENKTLSREIEVSETVISASHNQNEMNKPLVDFDHTQLLQSCEVTINSSQNNAALIGNVTDQTLKIKPCAEFKSLRNLQNQNLTLSKLITNILPPKVSSESVIGDISCDCTVQGCNLSIENQIAVQYPPLPGTMENTVEAKLLPNCNNNFSFFKGLDKCYHNSFCQFEVNKNICNPSKGKISIDINGRLASEQLTLSNTNTYVKSVPCNQLEVQKPLLEGKSKYISSQKVPNKPLLNTVELSQGISNVNHRSRIEGALACLKKKQCDVFDHVEVFETKKCNNLLFQTEFFISSTSDEQTNSTTASNTITSDKTIQLDDDTLDAEYFDDDIDKAIDESMKKYASFTCDKGVLATPDTSDKSSQTDKTSKEGQLSCKRCLNFEGEDFRPSKFKRTKTYHGNSKISKFSSCEQVGPSSLTELMSRGIKYDSNLNINCINLNDSNKCTNFKDDFTRTKNNVLQIISKDSSLTITQGMKENIDMDTLCGGNSNLNDEFSLYDEEMDVEDELNWSKDSKEIYKNDSDPSDHKVPVVEEEVARTELVKSK